MTEEQKARAIRRMKRDLIGAVVGLFFAFITLSLFVPISIFTLRIIGVIVISFIVVISWTIRLRKKNDNVKKTV